MRPPRLRRDWRTSPPTPGLRQAPVRLCKAVTSDLLVPASAEMVIEGEVLPDRVASEGRRRVHAATASPSWIAASW